MTSSNSECVALNPQNIPAALAGPDKLVVFEDSGLVDRPILIVIDPFSVARAVLPLADVLEALFVRFSALPIWPVVLLLADVVPAFIVRRSALPVACAVLQLADVLRDVLVRFSALPIWLAVLEFADVLQATLRVR